VRSIIPPTSGRPSARPPPTRHRRNMYYRFKCKADKKLYGQRWQAETVNSMIKRNLGSALRARTARRRSCELMLRVVTHNLMIFRRVSRGSRQSRTQLFFILFLHRCASVLIGGKFFFAMRPQLHPHRNQTQPLQQLPSAIVEMQAASSFS